MYGGGEATPRAPPCPDDWMDGCLDGRMDGWLMAG